MSIAKHRASRSSDCELFQLPLACTPTISSDGLQRVMLERKRNHVLITPNRQTPFIKLFEICLFTFVGASDESSRVNDNRALEVTCRRQHVVDWLDKALPFRLDHAWNALKIRVNIMQMVLRESHAYELSAICFHVYLVFRNRTKSFFLNL